MDAETTYKVLAGVCTFGSGMFAGSAFYINTIEHPSRMTIQDTESCHRQWKETFDLAKKQQMVMHLALCAAGAGAYFAKPSKGVPWLVNAGILTINLPYTLLILKPNSIDPIYDDAVVSEKSDGYIRNHINSWNRYHGFRTVVNCVAFGYCLYTLLK